MSRGSSRPNALGLCGGRRRGTAAFAFLLAFGLHTVSWGDDYSLWTHDTLLCLNTTSSGAGVSSQVVNFPVLVRLNPDNWTRFDEMSDDGSDIRFSKNDGTHLPYEIERWAHGATQAEDTAEIWVLVDTVFGNDSTIIRMHWGNAGAGDSSQPQVVFDTANGFVGVYHLADDPNSDAANAIKDATYYANHGTSGGTMTSSNQVACQVGLGLDFENTNHNYITLANESNFDITDAITICAWVTLETWPGDYAAIVAKRDDTYRLHGSSTDTTLLFRCDGLSQMKSDPTSKLTAAQTFVVGRYTGSHISIWEDGVKSEQASSGTINTDDRDVTIGRNASSTSRDWDGTIDEVRISKVGRSDAWLTLCYENQRTPQTLVSFSAGACDPPVIKTHPADQLLVTENQNATFWVADSGGSVTYQWQSNDGGGWSTVSGATDSTYTVQATSANDGDWFRVRLAEPCGASVTSDSAQLTVCYPPSISAHPTDQTGIESGTNATFSVTAAGTGITYQWQTNGSGTWANVPSGGTNATYEVQAGSGNDGHWFRVVVKAGSCGSDVTSDSAQLTVCYPPSVTTPPSDQSVVEGGDATFTVTASGTGLTYQWQTDSSGSWAAMSGETASSFTWTSAALADSGDSVRVVVNGDCGSVTSAGAVLSVEEACVNVGITAHPQDVSDTTGDQVTFSVTATGTNLTYQWQTDGSGSWANMSGETGSSYTVTTTASMDGDSFRVIVDGDCGGPDTSNGALLTLCDPPAITSHPVDQSVTAGDNATFTVGASGDGLTYQWQTDSSGSWANMSGETGSSYSVTTTSAMDGDSVRVVVNGTCGGPLTSTGALLSVCDPPAITSHPVDQSVTAGDNATFTVGASGDGLTYQWQTDSSGSWANMSGETGSSYSVTTTSAMDGDSVRVVVNGTCGGPLTSTGALLSVCVPPVITSQPSDQAGTVGDLLTFSVGASGDGLSFQWQTDSTGTWADMAGETAATYDVTATSAMDGDRVRVVVNGSCGSITSQSAHLSVCTPPSVTTPPADQAVTVGEQATFTVTAAGTNLSYQWQTDSSGSWVNMSGETGTSYTVTSTAEMDGDSVRVVVGGDCGSATSAGALLSVCVPPAVTGQPSDASVTAGDNATFGVTASGSPTLIYQWQRNDGGWSNVSSGGTAADYTFGTVSADDGVYLRAIVSATSACATPDTSDSALLSVCTPPSVTSSPSDTNVVAGQAVGFSVAATGTGLGYQWQSNPGGGWSDIGPATSASYTFTAGSTDDGTWYRAVVSGSCGTVTSDSALLSVCTPASITTDPSDQLVTSGATVTLSIDATGSDLTYQWQRDDISGGWGDIGGATANPYSFTASLSDSAVSFRCVVSAPCGSAQISGGALITVTTACVAPAVTAQPADTTVVNGNRAVFRVTATGTDLLYQWQSDTGSGWEPVSGATLSSYAFDAGAGDDGTQFGVVVSNGCGQVTSDPALLSVCLPARVLSGPRDTSVTSGVSVRFSVDAAGTGATYRWERHDGGGWSVLTGETGAVYTFVSGAADDGDWVRAIVSADCGGADTSRTAVLTVCDTALVTTDPAAVTVDEGAEAEFAVGASGTSLGYGWQYDRGAGWVDTGTGTDTLLWTASLRDDGTRFRAIVSARCGTPDTSAAAVLGVNNSAPPGVATSLTLNPLGPTSFNVRWDAPESPSGDADSAWARFATGAYPSGPSDGAAVGAAAVGDTGSERSFTVASGLSPQTTYFVALFIGDTAGNVVLADTGRVTTLERGAVVNPVVVRGTRVDSAHVSLRLDNFCQLPADQDPFAAYAEAVYLWYAADGWVTDPLAAPALSLDLQSLQASAGCAPTTTFDTTITVEPLPAGADSFYHFTASVQWRNTASGDSIPRIDTANGERVLMFDIVPVVNSLVFDSASYSADDTTLTLLLRGGDLLTAKADSVAVWYGYAGPPDFTSAEYTTWYPASEVRGGETFPHTIHDPSFFADTQRVQAAVVVRGVNGLLSEVVETTVVVGTPLPENDLTLTATALNANQVALAWGDGGDSVRIWYGTAGPVPLTDRVPDSLYESRSPLASAGADTISTLDPLTTYYFGIQLWRAGQWSPVTAAARKSLTMPGLAGNDTIPNRVRIDSLRFDPDTREILVSFTLDTAQGLWSESMQVGLAYAFAGYPDGDTIPQRVELTEPSLTVPLDLGGRAFVFDTTYYVAAWLRTLGTFWAAPTDSSRDTIRTPAFTWDPVTYFAEDAEEVTAFNGKVILRKVDKQRWTLTDTLDFYAPDTVPSGMVRLGMGFEFRNKLQSAPFSLGIRTGALPDGVSMEQVGVYRVAEDGTVTVVHGATLTDSVVWITTNELSQPFVLLADTAKPEVGLIRSASDDPTKPVTAGEAVIYTFRVSDAIANPDWVFEYGWGNEAYHVDSLDTLSDGADTVRVVIPADSISHTYGLRARLIAGDGVNRDTLDLSRTVWSESVGDIGLAEGEWTPVTVTGDLDKPKMSDVLADLGGGSGKKWAYDNRVFRVFRFLPDTGANKSHGAWVEYADSIEQTFRFRAGRIAWIKTRDSETIRFGAGTSLPLTKPRGIELGPRSWTDFAVPYPFGVYLRDVLVATRAAGVNVDTLQFCHWDRGSDGSYTIEETHTGFITDLSGGRDTVLLASRPQKDAAYCVYNPYDTAVTLRVPPVPKVLSNRADTVLLAKPRSAGQPWSLRLESRVGSRRLNTVYCGVDPRVSADMRFPCRPAFSRVSVGVLRRARGSIEGHAIMPRLEEGGTAFEIVYRNAGDRPKTVRSRLAGLDRLPAGIEARMLVPGADGYERSEEIKVELPPGASTSRWMVTGTEAYFSDFVRGLPVHHEALIGAGPSPFRRRLAIRYSLAHQGARRVELSIYDVLGRRVWTRVLTAGLRPGAATVVWDGAGSSGEPVSPGTYLVRVRIEDHAGTTRVYQTRVSRVR